MGQERSNHNPSDRAGVNHPKNGERPVQRLLKKPGARVRMKLNLPRNVSGTGDSKVEVIASVNDSWLDALNQKNVMLEQPDDFVMEALRHRKENRPQAELVEKIKGLLSHYKNQLTKVPYKIHLVKRLRKRYLTHGVVGDSRKDVPQLRRNKVMSVEGNRRKVNTQASRPVPSLLPLEATANRSDENARRKKGKRNQDEPERIEMAVNPNDFITVPSDDETPPSEPPLNSSPNDSTEIPHVYKRLRDSYFTPPSTPPLPLVPSSAAKETTKTAQRNSKSAVRGSSGFELGNEVISPAEDPDPDIRITAIYKRVRELNQDRALRVPDPDICITGEYGPVRESVQDQTRRISCGTISQNSSSQIIAPQTSVCSTSRPRRPRLSRQHQHGPAVNPVLSPSTAPLSTQNQNGQMRNDGRPVNQQPSFRGQMSQINGYGNNSNPQLEETIDEDEDIQILEVRNSIRPPQHPTTTKNSNAMSFQLERWLETSSSNVPASVRGSIAGPVAPLQEEHSRRGRRRREVVRGGERPLVVVPDNTVNAEVDSSEIENGYYVTHPDPTPPPITRDQSEPDPAQKYYCIPSTDENGNMVTASDLARYFQSLSETVNNHNQPQFCQAQSHRNHFAYAQPQHAEISQPQNRTIPGIIRAQPPYQSQAPPPLPTYNCNLPRCNSCMQRMHSSPLQNHMPTYNCNQPRCNSCMQRMHSSPLQNHEFIMEPQLQQQPQQQLALEYYQNIPVSPHSTVSNHAESRNNFICRMTPTEQANFSLGPHSYGGAANATHDFVPITEPENPPGRIVLCYDNDSDSYYWQHQR